jgi:hypothetical protein
MNGLRWLRRALRSVALRGLLAALLLSAQHGALTHVLAHAGGHIEAVAHGLHDDCAHGHDPQEHRKAPGAGAQCAFDLLYSELLGGAPLVAAPPALAAAATAVSAAATPVVASVTTLPYHSRGPPARA